MGDHVPLGLFRRYLPAETRYITILRDPVDRVLSHYHFHAQAGNPPMSLGPAKLKRAWEDLLINERNELGGPHEAIAHDDGGDFSLEEGLRRRICIYDNFMTRFLWGGESLFGELPPNALDRAKENVADMWFVGVRERLDESIVLLGKKLGVGLMPYNLRHVSMKRPPLEETSAELRELVSEHNALDVELYRFARRQFDKSAPTPGELDSEVKELRRRSAEITEAVTAQRSAKTKAERRTGRKRERRAQRAEAPEAENAGTEGSGRERSRRRRKAPKAERKASRAGTEMDAPAGEEASRGGESKGVASGSAAARGWRGPRCDGLSSALETIRACVGLLRIGRNHPGLAVSPPRRVSFRDARVLTVR